MYNVSCHFTNFVRHENKVVTLALVYTIFKQATSITIEASALLKISKVSDIELIQAPLKSLHLEKA